MTEAEKQKSIRKLDKLMVDSENMLNQAMEKAKTETLSVYLRELAVQRRELLSELDRKEMEVRDDFEDKGSVGGSMHGLWMKDADFSSDEAILKEIYNGEKYILERFEHEMGKPIDMEYRKVLDDAARTLMRNTATMKNMIDSNEIHA